MLEAIAIVSGVLYMLIGIAGAICLAAGIAGAVYLVIGAGVGLVAFLVDSIEAPRRFRWWHFPVCMVAWPLLVWRI